MRLTLDSFCLFASLALVLTLFSRLLHHPTHQIRPSSVQKKGKETHAFIFEYAPAAISQHRHPAPKRGEKKEKQQKTEKHKHSDAQTDRHEAQS